MNTNDKELKLAGRLANLWECFYITAENFKENRRTCPFYSEAKGMEMALTTMGISFDYDFKEFNGEYRVSEVKVGDHTATVAYKW